MLAASLVKIDIVVFFLALRAERKRIFLQNNPQNGFSYHYTLSMLYDSLCEKVKQQGNNFIHIKFELLFLGRFGLNHVVSKHTGNV